MPRSTAKQSLLASSVSIGPGHNQPPEALPDVFDGRLTISIDETAAALSIGRDAIYIMIGDGRLIASKFGVRTVVHVASIRRLLEATQVRFRPRARTLARARRAAEAPSTTAV
jgi:hypothetical protein